MIRKILLITLPMFILSCSRPSEVDLSSGWRGLNIDVSGFSFPEQPIPADIYVNLVKPETDTTSWNKIDKLPAAITMERKKQLCLLRKDVVIPESMKGRDLALYVGKVWDTEITFFNGVRIGASGNDYPDFHSDWNVSISHYIPRELINYGGENTIVIRQFSDQQLNFNGAPFIGNDYRVRCYTFMERFMAEYLVMGLAIMTLVAGLVAIAVWITGRVKNTIPLYFGGISVLWFILTMHFWMPCYGFISWRAQDNIFYLLVGVIVVLIYLFLELILGYRFKYGRIIIFILFLLQAALALTSTVASPITGWRFDIMGPVGVLGQILWGYVIVRGIRDGNSEAKIIMAGYLVFVLTLIHDALMMNRIIMSYAFLTNIAYPAFILSFAIILLRRISVMNADLIVSRGEIERNNSDLQEIISNIMDAVEEIKGIAASLSETSDTLNFQMENQSSSLAQTSASTEEVSASISSIAQHASAQDSLVIESVKVLDDYLNAINRITEAAHLASSLGGRSREETDTINGKLMLVREGIVKIRESSTAIENIADMINEIAEKTNLLSLNAAIEAARAGQSGRGFAVVADEIGKLADLSVDQAKTIQRIIQDVVSNIETENRLVMESVDAIVSLKTAADDVNNAVAEIMNLCDKQETLTGRIREGIKHISMGSNEISTATKEQQTAMQEVMKAILLLNDVVEQVSLNTVKMLSISDKLSGRVDILSRFTKTG